ncbi:diguanylate cyclase [Psychrosphaera haliotis]|uniref:sensor domain-containing diguanylate cyclase n=1 Tax=Psychrosphaera haliotis TaxID=555083 RepID=UPI0031E2FE5B
MKYFPQSIKLLILFLSIVLTTSYANAFASGEAASSIIKIPAYQSGTPGKLIQYFQEQNTRLTFQQAQQHFSSTQVKTGSSDSIALGIGVDPVWLKFKVNNTQINSINYRLSIETPWLDYVDTYLLQDGQLQRHIPGGDAVPFDERPMQYRFYGFEHDYNPGITEILIRVESIGPMALPVRFSESQAAISRDISTGYQYGILWGIMAALGLYNLVLFFFVKQKIYGLYSLYLIGFVLNSLSYTGHIHAVYTPDFGPYWQDWVDITLMLTYSVAGLHFARQLLDTKQYAPLLDKIVTRTTIVIPAGMLLGFIFNQLAFSVILAFILNSGFVVLFVAMGLSALKTDKPFAVIFLFSSVLAAICITISTLAVGGFLVPYNDVTFKVIEVGVALEAILLAVILARQFRMAQLDKIIAERFARTDSLTQVNNRLGFNQVTLPIWTNIVRESRDASIVLIDVDDFKNINDSFGHAYGDEVLVSIAKCLKETARKGDVVARWGGEEFILFLPETTQHQALLQAERLRKALQNVKLEIKQMHSNLTVSVGVAGSEGNQESPEIGNLNLVALTTEKLINYADIALYTAKHTGKNKVCGWTQQKSQTLSEPHTLLT